MSTPADQATGEADAPKALVFPTLAEGAELVGEFKNSGYREPPQLVCLPNRQLVRLPPLLFHVAEALHDHRHLAGTRDVPAALEEVAAAVGERAGARLTAEQIVYLVDRKLAPLGVTAYSDGTAPPTVKANPFLGLKFKVGVCPERVTWIIGGLFAWLLRPLIAVPVVAAVLAAEVWLFTSRSVAEALQQTLLVPVSILMIMGLGVLSCVFHEFGHAAACRYGGVRPGVMGCGIYIVWPAFFTDITESYRLGRAGRLRADLAGVYFNGIFVLALTALYLATGFEPVLVAVLFVNFEMIQQLLPTLRFDGYYIMSDLIGIPDLFKYIGPILRRQLLRRPPDPRLKELKLWPQIFVTAWVLTVIPLLVLQLGFIVSQIPALIVKDWQLIRGLVAAASNGADTLQLVTSGLQIFLLILPVAGVLLILFSFGRQLVRWAVRYVNGPSADPDAARLNSA
ncbi:MAG: hypothetical protein FWJ90_10240 [Actinomadura sp.]